MIRTYPHSRDCINAQCLNPMWRVPLTLTMQLDKNLVAHHNPQSFEAEQFRMLRTNIMFPAEGKASPRTILVTSALPGEGKSFVSSNLALTIAQNIDKHVLLIDCDMRRPTVHKLFGYENAPGLEQLPVPVSRALSGPPDQDRK